MLTRKVCFYRWHPKCRSSQFTNWSHLVNGEMGYLWPAVDHEGEVLESFVTKPRWTKLAESSVKLSHGVCNCPSNDHLPVIGSLPSDTTA